MTMAQNKELIFKEGQEIGNSYVVERFLGEGAFAEVYRVRHRYLGRQAMKVFKTIGLSQGEIEQMLGEAVILSQIGHPNIIRVFNADSTQTTQGLTGFFTMEYVAGGSLENFWRSFGGNFMPIETAVEVLCQASRGIAVAHSEKPPIIHRDIKPQNILVGYDATGLRVRVSDFGLSKRANPLTLLVSAKGTRIYKSPETFEDYKGDSCRGDVWALGCTLYLLLTDRHPYLKPDEDLTFEAMNFNRPFIKPSQLNILVDPALEQIVCRCLALKPEDRYPSARELLADLEKWQPQPAPKAASEKVLPTGSSKSALGYGTTLNQKKAQEMVDRAFKLARQAGKLSEAADIMEEAFNKWPELRDEYEYQVKLWRNGIIS